jgi:hypothetical protein
MKMAKELRSSDITGFQIVMREAVKEGAQDSDKERLCAEIDRFSKRFRELDAWKLKHERAGRWQPGEPCMHRGSPCVVVGVSATRVMVQKWTMPKFKLDHPVSPKATWLDPANLTPIHTGATWDTWRGMMQFCGQRVNEWTTSEFRVRMEAD